MKRQIRSGARWLLLITFTLLSGGMFASAQSQVYLTPLSLNQQLQQKTDVITYQRLFQQLAQQGKTRVIVRLKSKNEPMAELSGMRTRSKKARQARRAAIQRLQAKVLNNLYSSAPMVSQSFQHLPYIVMEVDAFSLDTLSQLPEVAEIWEDRLFKPILDESAVQMGADIANFNGYTGEGFAVAVLDTGADLSHSTFANVAGEACFSTTSVASSSFSLCPAGSNPNGEDSQFGPGAAINCTGMLGCDHGTHVAGIALGSDLFYQSVAPEADLVAVQVFSGINDFFACGFFPPCLSAFTSDVIRALEWVYDQRDTLLIKVVNMSLGGEFYTTQAECDAAYSGVRTAVENLRSVGIATVIASGNDGVAGALSTPACVTGAISVGAVDDFDEIASFTNTADFLTILTPGVGIVSSVPGGTFGSKDGTSMAAPHAAGAVAALNSANPAATVDEIVAAITQTGIPITDPIGGFVIPRIQLDEAAELLRPPMLSDVHLALQPVISGLTEPVAIANAGDGSDRLFIDQRDGVIRIDDGQNLLATPYLDLSSVVSCCGGPGFLV